MSGSKRVDRDSAVDIASLYKKGVGVAEIADRYSICTGTVTRVAMKHGAKRRLKKRVILTVAQQQQLVELYASGVKSKEIASRFDTNINTVAHVVKRLGGTVRPVGRMWRGQSFVNQNGYRAVVVPPGEPLTDAMRYGNGLVLEHRLVMARHIGRPLRSDETVHHVNGDRLDNRIANLQLRIGRHGKGAAFECADCGSCNIVAVRIADKDIQ